MKTATLLVAVTVFALASCASSPPPCDGPQTRNLTAAVDHVKGALGSGCAAHFDRYYDDLLRTAEGDPKPENKRVFSEFLVWTSDSGLLSKRQAQETWNRYFNVKFVSLRGDYNNCAQTCPVRRQVMTDMEQELADKERGMLQAALDQEGYYRADRLLSETELVLEATCRACEAGGR